MSRPFYPFVNNDGEAPEGTMQVSYPARIAVYDDAAAAPRVVTIDPKEPRAFLEEITATVVRLAKEQGGTIPFMVIREVVENFIHAYFIQPTISILDGGETIRFSDQGPGIKEKERALEYGTSSATEEMKQYIRGVGSGLPYAQQYMVDKGGSLTIEDNIAGGTVVTISGLAPEDDAAAGAGVGGYGGAAQVPATAPYPPAPTQGMPPAGYGYPAQPYGQPPQQPMPAQGWGYPPQQGYGAPQPAYQQQAYPQTGYPQPYQQQGVPQQPVPQTWAQPMPQPPAAAQPLALSERGRQIMLYLAQHEAVGPVDLARQFGGSQPTWSRELNALDAAGLTRKPGGQQKRSLTDAGRAFVATLQ